MNGCGPEEYYRIGTILAGIVAGTLAGLFVVYWMVSRWIDKAAREEHERSVSKLQVRKR